MKIHWHSSAAGTSGRDVDVTRYRKRVGVRHGCYSGIARSDSRHDTDRDYFIVPNLLMEREFPANKKTQN